MSGPNKTPTQGLRVSARPHPASVDQLGAEKLEPFLWLNRPSIIEGACLGSFNNSLDHAVPQARPWAASASELRR